MIKITELRLGNYVYAGNKIERVLEIYPDSITTDSYTHIFDFLPVELTPDILEAAGFKNGIKTIQTSFLKTELYVDLIDGDAGFNKHGLWFPCKYLHQLQNLYWCLCGEELQIDITKLNKEK